MNLKEYQEQAKRTCPTLGSDKLDLAHMVLGICSENEEVLKAIVHKDTVGIGEEIADQFWYIANYCTFRGFDLQELYNNRLEFTTEDWEEEVSIEDVKLSKLQDYVKKYIAYNKPLNKELEENCIKGLLFGLMDDVDYSGLDLSNILDNNIAKLKVRFPEKFTEENALNRNLEAERVELEK